MALFDHGFENDVESSFAGRVWTSAALDRAEAGGRGNEQRQARQGGQRSVLRIVMSVASCDIVRSRDGPYGAIVPAVRSGSGFGVARVGMIVGCGRYEFAWRHWFARFRAASTADTVRSSCADGAREGDAGGWEGEAPAEPRRKDTGRQAPRAAGRAELSQSEES